jgi:hypothetical protein
MRRDGSLEALLGVDEEGWFPLRVRASDYEVSVLASEGRDVPAETDSQNAEGQAGRSAVQMDGGSEVD